MVRSGDLLGHAGGESAVSWRAARRECRPDNIRAVRFRRWCVRRRGQTSKARVRKESWGALIGGRNDACGGGGGRAGMHVPEAVVQASTTLPCALNLCNSSADPSRRRVPVAHSCPKLPPPLNLLSHLHLMNQLLSVDPPPLCKSSRRCTPQLPRAAGHLLRHASPTAI